MSKADKILARLLRGASDTSFSFDELRRILLRLGFEERVKGSHHIFSYPGVPEILNLQPKRGQAKAYQVKQVRTLIVNHKLASDGNP